MATSDVDPRIIETDEEAVRLRSFVITGLFGKKEEHQVRFPDHHGSEKPGIVILAGRNGAGKTTILRMIDGILELNFDVYRKVPFKTSNLTFSDGSVIFVQRTDNPLLPLSVSFTDRNHVQITVDLARDRANTSYSVRHQEKIDNFRKAAFAVTKTIDFQLLDIHRSLPLRGSPHHARESPMVVQTANGPLVLSGQPDEFDRETLKGRVQSFTRDAQVNYRKYFSAEDLELLPRLLRSVKRTQDAPSAEELLARLQKIEASYPLLGRLGLEVSADDLDALRQALDGIEIGDVTSLKILAAYVDVQESRSRSQQLIADRLQKFEEIMDEFLIGKDVRVSRRFGLSIVAGRKRLQEVDLSSGEFHFLYMMVAALTCRKMGSVIAIDEPELSLHVTWQRKLIRTLSQCAAGAAPTFLLATHSSSIAAEYRDRIVDLSEDD